MASALVEDATNADFGTGPTYPDNGDSGTVWWGVQKSAVQQLCDRSQELHGWNSLTYNVPLIPSLNSSSRFDVDGSGLIWAQISVTDGGGLYFPIGGRLPVGRKITAVTALITGASDGTLPAVMPTLKLQYLDYTTLGSPTGGDISSATDATTPNAAYVVAHTFGSTGLSHTINANYQYAVKFTGATSTHSAVNLYLRRITLTLAY